MLLLVWVWLLPQLDISSDTLIAAADKALYQAKDKGRDSDLGELIGIEITNASYFIRDSILESTQGKILNLSAH